jgi:diphthine-ammonia ligase
MKFVALVSGGKDSFYSIMECIRNGHELVACAHLSPRRKQEVKKEGEEEESYMYQTAASEAVTTLVEDCLGVPLIIRQCVGRSQNTSLVYDHGDDHNDIDENSDEHNKVEDEVEDLYELLIEIKAKFPSVEGISSGAILSTYQRTRIESVCARLNLTPLGYLWRSGTQRELLECMLKDGIEAVLVKVASPPGLMPRKHLNKTLGQLFYGGIFDKLKDRFDFHICGEGGEYETLVLDCPLFKKRLVLSEVEIEETDDGVGILQVIKCCAVDKEINTDWAIKGDLLNERIHADIDNEEENLEGPTTATATTMTNEASTSTSSKLVQKYPQFCILPHVKILSGGLAHVSEIISQTLPQISDLNMLINDPKDQEAELAVLEAKCVFNTLALTLSTLDWTCSGHDHHGRETDGRRCHSATAKDVVFVHLYLSSISHFAKINTYYQQFFGIVLPPSRSCVAVGENVLPDGRRVMLDCIIQRGSGAYMRIQPEVNLDSLHALLPNTNDNDVTFIKEQKMNPHHKLRSTLHVQTISHWAPICVGPYSQANILRSGLILLAGQIGLVPGTMQLIEGGWTEELAQCWKNAACVLDALDGSLKDVLGGVVYISSDVVIDKKDGQLAVRDQVWENACRISRQKVKENGGVIAGKVDERKMYDNDEEEYGGYEDYETWKEVMGSEENQKDYDCIDICDDVPLLMVALPQMPKGAISEVELICATNKATSCLNMNTSYSWELELHEEGDNKDANYDQCQTSQINVGDINWDIGYNGQTSEHKSSLSPVKSDFGIESVVQSIGNGCSAIANVIAYNHNQDNTYGMNRKPLNIVSLLHEMVHSAMNTMAQKAGLDKFYTLHIRLFYTNSSGFNSNNLRCALQSVLSAEWVMNGRRQKQGSLKKIDINHIPACSIVPVDAIYMSPLSSSQSSQKGHTILGMQIITANLVHMETEMWIHHNRSYND